MSIFRCDYLKSMKAYAMSLMYVHKKALFNFMKVINLSKLAIKVNNLRESCPNYPTNNQRLETESLLVKRLSFLAKVEGV